MADLNQVQLPNGNTYNFVDTEGRKEENLVWGGPHKAGDVSPVGMALSEEHSANRMAFFPGSAITCEYSSDSGATWADYGYSNDSKKQFCTTALGIPVGRSDGTTNYTTSHRTRITFTLETGTANYMYTAAKKLLLEISLSGQMTVTIEGRTGANYLNNVDTWVDWGTYNIAGWSGWNDIPLVQTLGGGSNQTSQYWQFRLIFIITAVNTQYPTTASVNALRLFGATYWATPSTLAKTGHLYTFDYNQNATFPGQVNSAGLSTTGVAEFKNGKMPLSGGRISGLADGTSRVYGDGIAISNPATSNDVGFIRVTGTGESDTVLEIATGDDAGTSSAESIVARQYNTSNTVVHEAKILDGNGDSAFPGIVTTNGIEVKGVIAGDSGSTGHGLYGGGGYHSAYNNILLHGDNSTASSGIAFVSDRVNSSSGVITNVNQPSDRAFIQYHAYGITSATSEGTNPTLASSGESGRLVIGIGNDATDQVWLQTPSRTGLIHQVGAASYTIPDTGNTSGNVGSATQPAYLTGGALTACTYSLNATVPSDAVFTDTKNTAGSTDTSSKIYLIGATEQSANPQTYSQDTAYVGTDGCLYSGGTKVLTSETDPTVPSWAKASSKPSYNFSEIGAGVATIGDGANRVMFRTHADYRTGMYYSTPGNEAMVFANKHAVTSWMFVNTDPNNMSSWQTLTPALQVKNQRVAINKLIANGTDAAYNLDVNGTINAQTSLILGGSATLVYNSTTQSVDFTFS